MGSLGDAVLELKVKSAQFVKDLDNAESKARKSVNSTGKALTATLTPAVVGFGALAVKSFKNVQSGAKAVAAGTGAVGPELEKLQESYKKVAGQVPQDLETVGNATADVNTRLGLTGKALEKATKGFLDMSRVTGGDVQAEIRATARVMKDWGVEADQVSTVQDKLLTASQKTGIGVDQLGNQVVQFGSPLRQMGFTMDQTIATLANFEAEGVNAELVMGSMRIALGKMAREGVTDSSAALKKLIKDIKEAGSTGEANKLALEAFGARAGPDMAAAIREGRFEVEDLEKALQSSEGQLGKSTDAITDETEEMKIAWNQLQVSIAPIGAALMKIAVILTTRLSPAVMAFSRWFEKLGPMGQTAVIGVGAFLALLGPALMIIGKVVTAVKGLILVIKALGTALTFLAAHPIVFALIVIVGALILAYMHSEKFRQIVHKVLNDTMDLAKKFGKFVASVFDSLAGTIKSVGGKIVGFVQGAWRTISSFTRAHWKTILAVVTGPIGIMVLVVSRNIGRIRSFISSTWNSIRSFTTGTWNSIRNFITGVIGSIVGVIKGRLNIAKNNWIFIFRTIRSITTGIINSIKGTIVGAVNAIVSRITSGFNAAKSRVSSAMSGIRSGVTSALSGLASAVFGLASSIGRRIVDGIIGGATGLASRMKNHLEGQLKSALSSLNPFSPVEHGGEKFIGEPIVQGALSGIDGMAGRLRAKLSGEVRGGVRVGTPQVAFGGVAPGTGVGGGGPVVNLNLSGTVIGGDRRAVAKEMARLIQAELERRTRTTT